MNGNAAGRVGLQSGYFLMMASRPSRVYDGYVPHVYQGSLGNFSN
jgi:hypothetical protein